MDSDRGEIFRTHTNKETEVLGENLSLFYFVQHYTLVEDKLTPGQVYFHLY